jgi:hypothetical protein
MLAAANGCEPDIYLLGHARNPDPRTRSRNQFLAQPLAIDG